MALKILFSPSESKISLNTNDKFDGKNLIFSELFDKRAEILKRYDEFLKSANLDEIKKLFGLKELEDSEQLRESLSKKGSIKAILRYDGVAYKHLNYRGLSDDAQKYIDNNVLIFSNLFGPILAKDEIAEYKLKQGEKLAGFDISKFKPISSSLFVTLAFAIWRKTSPLYAFAWWLSIFLFFKKQNVVNSFFTT